MRLVALFGLGFPTATPHGLTLPHTVTRRPIMQKVRGRALPYGHSPSTACRRRGFRFYFTPLTGVLFTFPSRYLFTIGRRVVLSLGRWSSQIPAGFLVSCGTRVLPRVRSAFAYRAVTFSGRPFQTVRLASRNPMTEAPRPLWSKLQRFRLVPVRSPLLGESQLISVPRAT